MEVRAIRNETTYRAALAQVSALIDLDPAPDTPEGEQLEVLGTLVEAYESRHYPIAPSDPVNGASAEFNRQRAARPRRQPAHR
ncbi:hypothetical protein J7E49_13530 [Variovorax paradoxus]|nr:hypothetical protein [Variovorax paradoxus]